WNPADIDAVAYAFFDGDGEAKLIRAAQEKDAQTHRSDCTAASLQRLYAISSNGYVLNRAKRIPGFEQERDEFMPSKALPKRLAYEWMATSPRLDWRVHKHYFKQWA